MMACPFSVFPFLLSGSISSIVITVHVLKCFHYVHMQMKRESRLDFEDQQIWACLSCNLGELLYPHLKTGVIQNDLDTLFSSVCGVG
jgi:hypothetical protein